MSEKYSTNRLIDSLKRKHMPLLPDEEDAIIARLRDWDIMEAKLNLIEEIKKAIAGYEEKP